jgi:hypothetical protein
MQISNLPFLPGFSQYFDLNFIGGLGGFWAAFVGVVHVDLFFLDEGTLSLMN